MSGLYGMLMGRNPFSPYLLAALGITQETKDIYPLGRIRDVYTNDAADRIFILTRNYGEEWVPVDEALAKHPCYIGKAADSRDETYTVYEFSVPEDVKEYVAKIAEACDNTPAMDRYHQAIADLSSDKDNAQTRHMKEACKQIGEKLMGVVENGGDASVSTEFGSVEIFSPKLEDL